MENQILRMTKHQKHTNLVKKNNGIHATNEVAILGSNCGNISQLVHAVSEKITEFKLAYFDASHAKDVAENRISEFTFHHEGNLEVTTTGPVNKYQQRLDFAQHDFVFINGNHYRGVQQALILDPAKEASVLKRLDQLDNIQFVIRLNNQSQFFDFLVEKYPNIKELPIYDFEDIDAIANHFQSLIEKEIPGVKGLVLTGGKSTRMGKDKSELHYYNKPQKNVAKQLLENNGIITYFSVQQPSNHENEIHDTFLNLGPFGGICSAFQQDPNSAWFVLATDVPFVDNDLVKELLSKRNPSKVATAIKGKGKEFVEPLITIYEPKAYPILLQYLAQGYSCPRKILINSDIEIVEVDDGFIRNVNTPEEYESALNEIRENTKII